MCFYKFENVKDATTTTMDKIVDDTGRYYTGILYSF
jgi:hypothetical protein